MDVGLSKAIAGSEGSMPSAAGDIDENRAHEYSLLAVLLSRAPDAEALSALADVRGDASPLGMAHLSLSNAARESDTDAISKEFFRLFIGVGRGELMPYGSFYLTGFLQEKPLARLRADLLMLGIERAPELREPEDHIAILCEIMSGLCSGRFDAPPGSDRMVFERHLRPWAARFFADLEHAENAHFYRHVGTVGRMFMEIEKEAFAWAA